MRLARYLGKGCVSIEEEPAPSCPSGGLVVQTEASGLCSGELMDWYMDAKIPHVLGHEVSGRVIESWDKRFPVGSRVSPHHHASCLRCEACLRGDEVHCEQWRATKLIPGGMSEVFAVTEQHLTDTRLTDHLRPQDAALIEPVACVRKSIRRASLRMGDRVAVIGLGTMGLAHALLLPDCVAFDLLPQRLQWARNLGIDAREPSTDQEFDSVFLCPGTEPALRFALELLAPGGTLNLFSPLPPPAQVVIGLNDLYFRDIRLVSSYSCGPTDTKAALDDLASNRIRAEHLVSHFIALDELPRAYEQMKKGEILKAMVMFQ